MSEQLGVWFEQQRVGTIFRKGKVMLTFAYDEDWLQSGFPLSQSLPLQDAPISEKTTQAFFDNLLPEQGIRQKISKKIHVSEKNVFGFLETLGGECAGALSILPGDESPQEKPQYETVSKDKLGELISLLPKRPLLAGEDGIRLSLAGAQNKIPIAYIDGKFFLPKQGAASTHILKPPIDDLDGTVENEAFCMSLAKVAGLNVPEVEITETYPRGYLVKRYDRIIEPTAIKRIHQEDFCQAMGVPVSLKYQNEGGPGTQQCFELLAHCTAPATDRENLFTLIVFNFLIGNADAHAKNFSLLYSPPPQPTLAPFYDLLCTGAYERLSTKNAMKIGGKYDPNYTMKHHWMRLADQAGLSHPKAEGIILAMVSNLGMMASIVAEEFQARYGTSRTVQRIVEFIETRCNKVNARFS